MDMCLTINATDPQELIDILAAIGASAGVNMPVAEKPVVAEPEPIVAEPEPIVTAEPAPEPEPVASVTYDDVRAAVTRLAASKGRDAAIDALTELGVGHAKELPEDRWAEAVGLLGDKLEG